MVLPFWCWLTEVVLEKKLLNGCSVVVCIIFNALTLLVGYQEERPACKN